MKRRKIGTIWRNLQKFLNKHYPNEVKPSDALSDYMQGDFNLPALVAALNRYPRFKNDGIVVLPGSVAHLTLVGELFIALLLAYEIAGWEIVR